MTMVSTGPISLGGTGTSGGLNQSVNVELGRSGTATINMNESGVRSLAGVPSGQISMNNFYGKSNAFSFTATISSNTQNYNLLTAMQAAGYVNGSAYTVNLTINSGVYVWSNSTSLAGFDTGAITGTGTINLTNNGFIIGKGGDAGNNSNLGTTTGQNGGPAISTSRNIIITNNSYIAGGGGGGGGGGPGGGGGAGGGNGGRSTGIFGPQVAGVGGAIGQSGTTPSVNFSSNNNHTGKGGTGGGGGGGAFFIPVPPGPGPQGGSGGGGGRVLPGVGGAGGTGSSNNGGAGGSANANGGVVTGGGGGGGGGAAGGIGNASGAGGGSGGRAVQLNGNSVTWNATGTRYGAIS